MYVCKEITTDWLGRQQCGEWVEYQPFLSDLSQLTYQDASLLLSATAALFALAWAWKHVAFFSRRT